MVPGKATLHTAACAATKVPVLGDAWSRDWLEVTKPMEARCALVQRTTVFAPEPASVIVNAAEPGIVRQADAPVTGPRSSDHIPPGVAG